MKSSPVRIALQGALAGRIARLSGSEERDTAKGQTVDS